MQLELNLDNLPFPDNFPTLAHWVDFCKRGGYLFGSFTAKHKPSGWIWGYIDVLPSLICIGMPEETARQYARAFFGETFYQVWIRTASGRLKTDVVEFAPNKPTNQKTWASRRV